MKEKRNNVNHSVVENKSTDVNDDDDKVKKEGIHQKTWESILWDTPSLRYLCCKCSRGRESIEYHLLIPEKEGERLSRCWHFSFSW